MTHTLTTHTLTLDTGAPVEEVSSLRQVCEPFFFFFFFLFLSSQTRRFCQPAVASLVWRILCVCVRSVVGVSDVRPASRGLLYPEVRPPCVPPVFLSADFGEVPPPPLSFFLAAFGSCSLSIFIDMHLLMEAPQLTPLPHTRTQKQTH